jgi:hypothetical protein
MNVLEASNAQARTALELMGWSLWVGAYGLELMGWSLWVGAYGLGLMGWGPAIRVRSSLSPIRIRGSRVGVSNLSGTAEDRSDWLALYSEILDP